MKNSLVWPPRLNGQINRMSHGNELLPKVIDKSQADIDAAIAAIKAGEIEGDTKSILLSINFHTLNIKQEIYAQCFWARPKSHLAIASLVKAYKDEEAQLLLVKRGGFGQSLALSEQFLNKSNRRGIPLLHRQAVLLKNSL